MPCSDGRDFLSPEGVVNYELKAELNEVTRILCGLLTDIEKSGGMLLNDQAKLWWERHKQADAERLDKEEKQRLHDIARQEAIERFEQEYREQLRPKYKYDT